MKLSKILLVLTVSVLPCVQARADFYFEQNVHETKKGLSESQTKPVLSDFKRKIYVLGKVLAVQVEVQGKLEKEYGFDFGKGLYYEADPASGYFKLFDLKSLAEAFDQLDHKARAIPDSGRQHIVEIFSQNLLSGRLDYPVHVQRDFFAKKEFDGRNARLYKLRVGPGSSFFNPFGWYRTEKIWATTDVPGFSEYAAIRSLLEAKAAFYKIKYNRISDFIVILSALEGLPLRIDSVTRRRFERANSEETSSEDTSIISTAKIKPERLLYFDQNTRFSLDAVYSKGTQFGREASWEQAKKPDVSHVFVWFCIPFLFLIFSYSWFLGGFSEKNPLSLGRKVFFNSYVLICLLLALETFHYFNEAPFLVSPVFEFSLATALGAVLIVCRAIVHQRTVGRQMQEAHLRTCPHCHERCEDFYLICPKCNRSIQ